MPEHSGHTELSCGRSTLSRMKADTTSCITPGIFYKPVCLLKKVLSVRSDQI